MLRQRFITITGSMTATEADLIQQGAPGIDLAGNVAVDVTMSLPAQKDAYTITDFGEFFDDAYSATDPAKLNVSDRLITAPKDQCHDIKVDVRLTYVLRHVVSGGETLVEADDVVQFRKGTLSSISVVVVPADELKVPTWTLKLGDRVLHFQRNPGVPGDVPQPIMFDSFETARTFLVWLNKTQTSKISGRVLMLGGLPATKFDPHDAGQLLVVRNDATCPTISP